MDKRSPRQIARVIFTLAALAAAPAAQADGVDELRTLVGGNDATAAWAMAQRMEPANAGEPEFDFWYGLAAKAAGQRNQAQFAFERVVVAQPENPRAKLELADVYHHFGNHGEATKLFNEVLAENPPEPVQQRIRTYLGSMQAASERKETQVSYVLGVALGHDDNVGSATDVSTHDTFFGPATLVLNPQAMASDAAFMETRAGIDVVSPANQRTLRFLSVSAQRRDNEDFFSGGNFDSSQFGLTGGWMLRRGIATWRIPLAIQALWAESATPPGIIADDDRYQFSVGAEYTRPLSSRTAIAWVGRVGTSHFPSAPERNAALLMLGSNYSWSADSAPITVQTSLSATWEPREEDTALARNNEKEITLAARVGARWKFSGTQSATAGVGVQGTHYRQTPLVYPAGPDRKDLLQDFSLGWQMQLEKAWVLNADVSVFNNDSQRSLYDFDRTQFKFGSTWRF